MRRPLPYAAFFLVLATLLHWWGLGKLSLQWEKAARVAPDMVLRKNEPIPVERWTDSDKPVVQTTPSEEEPKEPVKDAPYAGEFKNRVRRQTQAARKGAFQEAVPRPEVGVGGMPGEKKDDHGEVAKNASPNGDGGDGKVPQLTMRDLLGQARSPNKLGKDVDEGEQTVLNTDPVRYASFINRIAEEIYGPWVSRAREAVSRVYNDGRKLDANTYVTKLSILMDAKGGIQSIQVLESSGVNELDEAPKKAFWAVEPFLNPPTQMFQQEETARFVYEFHFEWRSSGFNIVPFRI